MQYLTLYIVLFVLIFLSFMRGKHILFNLILIVYPTAVIYKGLLEYTGTDFLQKMNFGVSDFTMHLVLFICILLPVYISMMRIVNEFRLRNGYRKPEEYNLFSYGEMKNDNC